MTGIPIFVINLDRRADRLSEMHRRLSAVPFERIASVDGRALTVEDVARFVSPRRPYEMSRQEVGCFLSHRKTWQTIVDRNLPVACVLEDDVQLSPDFSDFVGTRDWLPASFDLIKIETMLERTWISREVAPARDRMISELRATHFGAGAYLMSRAGASRLLALTTRPDRAVDDYLFERSVRRSARCRVLQLSPALCAQDSTVSGCSADSDLAAERARLRSLARAQFWNKIRRRVQKRGQRVQDLVRRMTAEPRIIPYA